MMSSQSLGAIGSKPILGNRQFAANPIPFRVLIRLARFYRETGGCSV
jgi:hypothetical protein